jgi:hypothetical protein
MMFTITAETSPAMPGDSKCMLITLCHARELRRRVESWRQRPAKQPTLAEYQHLRSDPQQAVSLMLNMSITVTGVSALLVSMRVEENAAEDFIW